MGCGKTALARALASRLRCEMVDLDEAVTQRKKRSPARIFEEDGEAAFRIIETLVLRDVLAEQSGLFVIALGGGAWISAANRALINQHSGFTVWLDAPFETCWERISLSEDNRPLGKSKQQAQELYESRRPMYQLANSVVAAGAGISLDDLARQVESGVSHLGLT